MAHPAASYWNRGIDDVPRMTGARDLLDASDMPQLAEALGFSLPLRRVLDVGCGTGRIHRHCDGYVGVDVARDAVAYCAVRGISADVIDGPYDLATSVGRQRYSDTETIVCLSVFTHIDAIERRAYLAAFVPLADRVIVDIIPGDGRGNVELWTASVPAFDHDLATIGWAIRATAERTHDGVRHRAYLLE